MVKPEDLKIGKKDGKFWTSLYTVEGYPDYILDRQTRPGRMAFVVSYKGKEIGEVRSEGGDHNVPVSNFLADHINKKAVSK